MARTQVVKIHPGEIQFDAMNRHLKFLELDYLDVVTPEEIRKKGILTECANFYLRITPKGIDHISEMRRYIKPKYLRALKILEIIP